jgi:anti-sigma B factor antagonist
MTQSITNPTPQFKFDVESQPDVTVVRCHGRLVVENGSFLRNAVHKYIKPGAKVVLDLTNLSHCDSMGLGAVISLYVSSRSAGCRLEVINLGQNIRRLFSIANILSLFEPAADSTCRMP